MENQIQPILNINRTRLVESLKYNPNKIVSGVINGVRWQFLAKKQIDDNRYRYVYVITAYTSRGSFSGTRSMITGEMDIREVADLLLMDGYDDEY